MNPTYSIKSVKDFVDIATESNIDLILADFKNFIMLTISNSQLISDKTTFNWVDDGKNDVILDCTKNNWTKEEVDSLAQNIKSSYSYSEEYIDETDHNISVSINNRKINTKSQVVFDLPKAKTI